MARAFKGAVWASLALLAFTTAGYAADADSIARGQRIFGRCAGCHSSTDLIKIGPPLGGIVGRKAGAYPGFPYTKALAKSKLTWTATTLDRFLSNPRAMISGTAMILSVSDAQDRADLVAYLASLPAP